MFGKKYRLFNLLGFEVGIDASWIIIAILVAWSLSTGLFPIQYKNLSTAAYWVMGVFGALGLFLSIIVHEFAHSLVARRNGIPMTGITLFLFGGVAQMNSEPPGPGPEFRMAVIGPVTSFILGLIFYGIYVSGSTLGGPQVLYGVAGYLAMINTLLAVFNLIPAFPLDGGRILRAVLWKIKGNLKWATRISAQAGQGFGLLLIFFGILRIFSGNLLGGMWIFLIGMFLQNIAKMSYQQLLTRRALEGEPIRRFMKTEVVTVSPDMTIDRVVEDYLYQYHYKMLPVVDDQGRLLGCVTLNQIKTVARDDWSRTTVADIVQPCTDENTVGQYTDAVTALSKMNAGEISRLMVVDDNRRLTGVVALKDMLAFLSMKVELEDS